MWHRRTRPDSLDTAFITGIDQVCTVTRDFDATVKSLSERLGIGPFKCWNLESPALFNRTYRGQDGDWSMRLGVALVGRMQWEVIQPLTGPSIFFEQLERRGSGLHHVLLQTEGIDHAESVRRLEAKGFPQVQTAMVNLPLQVAGLTIPPAPRALADTLSTYFGYTDTQETLGTTLELARFPPGVSRPLGIRIGKPDYYAPADSVRITDRLQHSFIDRVEKLGFIVRDAMATVRAWADTCGVGPWHIVQIGPESIGNVQIDGASADFRAKVAWAMVGATLLEVIEPISGDTPHARLLEQRGSGLHYVGVRSDTLSIDEAAAHLRANGCPTLLQGVLFGGYEFALVDAGSAAQTWLELISLDAEPLYQQLCRLQPAQRYPR